MYLNEYEKALGPIGDYREGEIEIIRDLDKLKEIEKSTNRKIGVLAEDNYWIWLNDGVRFPKGNYGVYGRIIWRNSLKGPVGVVVLPILPNGKIALLRNYRHATRSWEYEIVRGGVDKGEDLVHAVEREVKEETGFVTKEPELLGLINPDSGFTNTTASVYVAKIVEKVKSSPEDSEAIAGIDTFTINEVKQGFLNGYLEVEVNGQPIRVNLRDPFLSYAIMMADLKGLL